MRRSWWCGSLQQSLGESRRGCPLARGTFASSCFPLCCGPQWGLWQRADCPSHIICVRGKSLVPLEVWTHHCLSAPCEILSHVLCFHIWKPQAQALNDIFLSGNISSLIIFSLLDPVKSDIVPLCFSLQKTEDSVIVLCSKWHIGAREAESKLVVEPQYLKSILAMRFFLLNAENCFSCLHLFFLLLWYYFSAFSQTHRDIEGLTRGEAYIGDVMGKPGIEAHISTHIPRGGWPLWSSHALREMRTHVC